MSLAYVIGDVHGCLTELKELLAQTDRYATRDDKYVFLGDYVDRGPDSKGVIDLLIERRDTHPVPHFFLKGNHEEMMVVGEHYWGLNGGWDTLASYGLESYDRDYRKKLPGDHWEFLNDLGLYHEHGRVVCVHAGINPHSAIDQQHPHDMVWDRSFVGFKGAYHDDKFVVYGHTPVDQPVIRDNQLGIDTGCVFGGTLTCAVLDEEGNREAWYTVKSGFEWKR
jgi:serine/threonine protein phosphatase 1